jgi:hypothetical protein
MRARCRLAASIIWTFWRDYTDLVAHYQSLIWLGLVYVLVVGPTGLTMRLLGKPLLPSTFGHSGSHWRERPPVPRDLPAMRRLY